MRIMGIQKLNSDSTILYFYMVYKSEHYYMKYIFFNIYIDKIYASSIIEIDRHAFIKNL